MKKVGGQVAVTSIDKSECFVKHDGVCARPQIVEKMHKFLQKEHSIDMPKKPEKLVEAMKGVLGVETEAEILQDQKFKRYAGTNEIQKEMNENFKEVGPHNSTALLDNFNIDGTLQKWSINAKKLFGKKFYHIPFQMIDFEQVGSELSRISIPKLVDDGYDCFACVLNTDVSSGRGIHWFCIYGDLEHKGTENDPHKIEFFNSSGNPPVRNVNVWMEKTCADMIKAGHYTETVRAAPRKLQWSKTECGMWSLMYILARLEGKQPESFYQTRADDKDMIRYRKFIFRGV